MVGAIQNTNPLANPASNCFVSTVSQDGRVSRSSIFEKAPRQPIGDDEEAVSYPTIGLNMSQPCVPYDSQVSTDGYLYVVGSVGGVAGLWRFNDKVNPELDVVFTANQVQMLSGFFPLPIVSASLYIVDGDVEQGTPTIIYSAWTISPGTISTTYILKHNLGDGSVVSFYTGE
jgi:hypothetical protein